MEHNIPAFLRTGYRQPEALPIEMNALAQEVWQGLEAQRCGREIEFRLLDLPPARGDFAAIRRGLHDLLDNAIRFTRGCTPALIEFGGQQQGAINLYYIKDNRDGASEGYVQRFFVLL